MQQRLIDILDQCDLREIFRNLYPNRPMLFDTILTTCKEYKDKNNINPITLSPNLCSDQNAMIDYLRECKEDNSLIMYDSVNNTISEGFLLFENPHIYTIKKNMFGKEITVEKKELYVKFLCRSGKFLMVLIIIVAILLNCDTIVLLPINNTDEFYESLGFTESIDHMMKKMRDDVFDYYKEQIENLKAGINVTIILETANEMVAFGSIGSV
jgi:hypothetical protein